MKAAMNSRPSAVSLKVWLCETKCFHTSTFGAHPGSTDVRVRFICMMWTLSSEPYPSPLKKGGLGYSSCELRYGSLLM